MNFAMRITHHRWQEGAGLLLSQAHVNPYAVVAGYVGELDKIASTRDLEKTAARFPSPAAAAAHFEARVARRTAQGLPVAKDVRALERLRAEIAASGGDGAAAPARAAVDAAPPVTPAAPAVITPAPDAPPAPGAPRTDAGRLVGDLRRFLPESLVSDATMGQLTSAADTGADFMGNVGTFNTAVGGARKAFGALEGLADNVGAVQGALSSPAALLRTLKLHHGQGSGGYKLPTTVLTQLSRSAEGTDAFRALDPAMQAELAASWTGRGSATSVQQFIANAENAARASTVPKPPAAAPTPVPVTPPPPVPVAAPSPAPAVTPPPGADAMRTKPGVPERVSMPDAVSGGLVRPDNPAVQGAVDAPPTPGPVSGAPTPQNPVATAPAWGRNAALAGAGVLATGGGLYMGARALQRPHSPQGQR